VIAPSHHPLTKLRPDDLNQQKLIRMVCLRKARQEKLITAAYEPLKLERIWNNDDS